jgi:hypothetical protein
VITSTAIEGVHGVLPKIDKRKKVISSKVPPR